MMLTGVWPDGLEPAFTAYEDALMADDTAALDALFAPGPETLRGDDTGLLRGHDRISAFRGGRGGVARRVITAVDVHQLAPDAALVVGESEFVGGGRGLQTQLWCRTEGRWRIRTAHVTGRPKAFDRSIWRVVGDPLVHGAADGPLAGVRVAVKDLFAVAGHVVGAGNPTWERSAPVSTRSASAVQVLLDAGAVVTGIARTDEFAYALAGRNAHFGSPPNGADPMRIGGGSTSGSASAVALGEADLGLGTDTAGSLRVPASYQGLWGLRTTHDAVPRDGVLPLAQSFDTVGWIARSSSVLAAAAAISLPGRCTAVDDEELLVSDALLAAVEPDTRAAFDAWLQRHGRAVRRIELPALDDLAETLRVVQAAEAWRNDGPWIAEHPGALGDDVAARFATAATITAAAEGAARVRLEELRTLVRDAIGGGVLCLPSVPGPAPLRTASGDAVLRTRAATLRMTAVAGVGGLPAVSAPLLTVDGAPVGVCLVGPAGSDRAIVELAETLL
ncbi:MULTISPECIES: AtzH-like domain-containing protein [unclassified Curtobacterium]|uniref:AtzH-like domain-containing protein n=1 Tax=unclassified Curtobacterium TaxID=257496 RepID=UPI000FBF7064|nr:MULTISPECIES: AtzH-like domain-containing protein [unclassified Curtobacterium]ROP60865.1 Asp-tRNA(Asn)/Glu-tRNA(Gln) amidotransferase A subunit family amidase [Curtobacterium sp. ZW137]TCK64240.1 Asp-tRNA(Asn)/Glu-tRNA(Gln) amidotransferase A subunit family amidase [Curtobacterium sp. PhB136]